MTQPTKGTDGFFYYTCSQCQASKIAALFTPEEIAGECRCRLCTGEVSMRYSKARKPTAAQQPRMQGFGHIQQDIHRAPAVLKR